MFIEGLSNLGEIVKRANKQRLKGEKYKSYLYKWVYYTMLSICRNFTDQNNRLLNFSYEYSDNFLNEREKEEFYDNFLKMEYHDFLKNIPTKDFKILYRFFVDKWSTSKISAAFNMSSQKVNEIIDNVKKMAAIYQEF
ncbi:hypothetical protein [Mesomycoplasma lagogenitalium]|uniref:Sigma-70 family RNA polymerase sigma factor n=1 Tax=Mesomycoplasma lagogenitalium TaxID=171286 RepID=A0ABY8LVQ5_9BACT|nr:hypothetical protein [Mesomycoplasma lagogenitalium]WGI36870.1 hypothetical protein QEG99_01125 [Mesomycoplasma lagogenitalium]